MSRRAVLLLLLAGCFNPRLDYAEGALTCPDQICPPGYSCHEGRCWRHPAATPGPDAMEAAPADAAPPPPPDAGAPETDAPLPPDAGVPDAGLPDAPAPPPPDAASPPGCEDNATRCAGKCGQVINDCGDQVDCGANGGVVCAEPKTCGADNLCVCVPEGQATLCQGKCGTLLDRCGQPVDCGGCTGDGIVCGGAQPDVCGCKPTTRMCDGLQKLLCVDGAWQPDGPACDFDCSGGECSGTCTPGAYGCNGNTRQHCTTSYQWKDVETCSNQTCVVDDCVGVCAPMQKRCLGNTPQACGATGQWAGDQPCTDSACVDGKCVGVCVPDTKSCDPTTGVPRTCNASGQWVAGTACTNQVCSGGACVGVCAPPAVTCQGTQGVRCTTSGTWEVDPACSGQCWLDGAGRHCTLCIPGAVDTSSCGTGSRNYDQCNSTGTAWVQKDICTGGMCGSGYWGDVCGISTVDCGGCGGDPYYCDTGSHTCACAPHSPCDGFIWGTAQDSCGNSYECSCASSVPRKCTCLDGAQICTSTTTSCSTACDPGL